jgi:HPt (histidine-containing phosphotransfer) domain-containing protein
MHKDKQKSGESLSEYALVAVNEPERKLLMRYLERKRDDLNQLEQALESEDFPLIRRIGHNLAGSGAAYGLLRISVLGRRIEAAAEGQSGADAAAAVAELGQFVSRIVIKD